MKRPIKILGYSLVETALSTLIIALFIAGGISYYDFSNEENKYQVLDKQLDRIEDAITDFVRHNGRLPYPSGRSTLMTDINFGKERSTLEDGIIETTKASRTATHGVVPVRTLGLPDKDMLDPWGRRIAYIIPKELAIDLSYNFPVFTGGDFNAADTDPLVIRDSNNNFLHRRNYFTRNTGGNDPQVISYILLSYGQKGRGGYNRGGISSSACPAITVIENQNCNDDAFFTVAPFNLASGNSYFDDVLRWRSLSQLKMDAGQESNKVGYAIAKVKIGNPPFTTGWATTNIPCGGANVRSAIKFNELDIRNISSISLNSTAGINVPPGKYQMRVSFMMYPEGNTPTIKAFVKVNSPTGGSSIYDMQIGEWKLAYRIMFGSGMTFLNIPGPGNSTIVVEYSTPSCGSGNLGNNIGTYIRCFYSRQPITVELMRIGD
jgi:hypothetical protein